MSIYSISIAAFAALLSFLLFKKLRDVYLLNREKTGEGASAFFLRLLAAICVIGTIIIGLIWIYKSFFAESFGYVFFILLLPFLFAPILVVVKLLIK